MSEKHKTLDSLLGSTTLRSNPNLQLPSKCFGLQFRFQMILFAEENVHLTAERGDFCNMPALFRYTLGKGAFSRGKVDQMEKPLAG